MEVDEDIFEEDMDGCILSIHVRNFFCHDNLKVNLNRNVNFIVGRNGSGKSAILIALVVGLGGRASATNRGSNLHSFIKKGSNSATIEIKIKNNSSKAYKHHLYGDYITIVRNINASGGSSYKVKSASGDIISTKYEEVNSIILAHDIQVDNPISVLNQDDARSFHASDAKKKYSLFRKATNLDQTETNYMKALENCKKAVSILNRKNVACLELEKEYNKWKTSHEQLQSRGGIENQKKALQNEYYWSEIAELEKEANTIQAQYEKKKAKMEKLVEKLRKMEQNYGSNNYTIEGLKEQLKEKSTLKASLEQELRALEKEVRETQSTWRSTQSSSAKQRELLMLNREQRKIAVLEREIGNIESGETAGQRTLLASRASAARAASEAARREAAQAQHEAAQAQADTVHKQHDYDQHDQRAQRRRDKLKQLRQQLRELESRGNDSLAVYGSHMVELCQKIAQADARGEFSATPKGPVGAYIKVKEKKWGGALEHILGGSIQSFCVNSAEDSRKLFKIMGQVYGKSPKPSVTCSKFLEQQHDVRRNTVRAAPFLSALHAVQVSDPVVANYLIDNIALERILLVPDHEDAVRLSDNENVPVNCSKIVTLDATEYHPASDYRSYGGAHSQSRYLQVSTAERTRQVATEIQETEAGLRALEARGAELLAEAGRATDHETQLSRRVAALLSDARDKEAAAAAAAAALRHDRTPHHTVLVEELNVSKEKYETLKAQIDAASSKDAEFRKRIEEYENKIQQLKAQLSQATSECRSLNEELDQEQMRQEQGASERRTWQQRVNEDKIKLTQVEAILEEKQRVVLLKVADALTLCPRIDNPRDKAIVISELKKIQLKQSAIRSDGLSLAEVTEKLLKVEGKYRRTKQSLIKLKKLIDDIQSTVDNHLKFCYRVQSEIARRVKHLFHSILLLRGYSGRMDIDVSRGALEVQCTGRDSCTKRVASSSCSLSGGERSYSTVAFIMALWECVELPFYFMDEFDVFMDDVNRKIVMELLIEHALKNTSRQFVFLTPQDASSVNAGPNITIHLMADPRP